METEAAKRVAGPAGDYYQAIFEAHPDAMVIFDRASGDILETNRRMCHLFGYSPEETRRLKFTDLGAPEATGDAASPWQPAEDSGAGAPARQVWQARDREGRQFRVEAHLQAVPVNGQAQALAVIRELDQPPPEAAALQEDEALYRLAMEGSLAGVYVIGEEGFIYVNPTLAQIFGYRPEEISGRLVEPHELVHPEDLALVRAKVRQRLSGELAAAHYTFRGLRRNGTTIFCESFGQVVEYQGRRVVVGTLLDITARQQAQEALRRSEARYRAIVEDQTELVTRFRPDGTLTFMNDAVCRYLGKSPEELLGKDFLPFIPAEDQAAIQRIFSLTPENPIVTLEHRVLTPDGEVAWQQWTNRAIFDGQGNLREYQAVGRDITQRKRAEEALQAQKNLLNTIFSTIPDLLVLKDRNLTYQAVNPAFCRYLGKPAEEILGRSDFDLFPPAEAEKYRGDDLKVLNTGVTLTLDEAVTGAQGRRWLQVVKTLLQNETGTPIGVLCSVRDLTERREMEKALGESEARYRMVTESSLAGVYVFQDDKFRYVNPVLAQIFGYEPEELIDRLGPLDLVYYEDRLQVGNRIKDRLAGKAVPSRYTFKGLHRDGSPIHCEVLSRVVEYQGRPALMGTVLDNTERRRAEEALKNSEAKYRAIFGSVNDAVFVMDAESGDLLEFNEKFLELTNYAPGEAGRLNIADLCGEEPPFTAQDAAAWLRKATAEGPQLVEWLVEDRAGRRFWVEVNLKRTVIGGQDRLLAVVRDISERKQAEDLQRQALEELEHRVEERTVWLRRANSQLLQEIEERKRAEEMLRLQRDLSLVLSGRVGMQETLRLCVEAALSISGMESGGVYLVDRASGSLNLAFHQGLSPEFAARVQHYEADSVNAHLVMAGKPIYARIRDLPGLLDKGALLEGFRSVAIIPVHHKDEIIAVINVASRTHEEVPETARVTLETIASQVGSAIARVQAEEALRASEERFRAFMDHLPGIAFMMDAGDRLVYLNQNLENLLRQSANLKRTADFLGKTNDELWPPQVAQKFHAENQQVLTRKESLQFIETLRQTDGLHHWLVHKFPILGQEGSPELVGGIATDITELKEAEEALRRAKEGLERRVAQRTAQLKEANQALQLELRERRKMEESLRQSEARYRTLVEQIPAITYIISLEEESKLLYISPQIETLLEFTSEEWGGREVWMRQIHPEDQEWVTAEVGRSLASGAAFTLEYRILSKSGRTVWFHDEARVVPDQEGKPRILQGLALDITKRKEAEEALRESEAKYRTLVEQIPAVTYLAALDNVVTPLYTSPQIESVLGFTPSEWLADPERFKQQIHPEDRDRVLTELLLSYSTGGPFLAEYRMLSKSGRVVWIRDESRAVYDREGRPLFMQGVALDITARKRGEEALQGATNKLRTLVQAAPLAIVSLDPQGRVMSWNPAAEQIFGWPAAEVMGRPLPLVSPEKEGEFREIFHRVSSGESLLGLELQRQRRDGSVIEVNFSASPLFDADGKLLGIMGIYEDISLRQRMAETVRKVSRALKAITGCHQALLRASNESELLNDICRLIVEVGGYRMAWVGFPDQTGSRPVLLAAQKGFDDGYVEQLHLTWADTAYGRGPVGTSIRTGRPAICRDTQTDPNFAPWREEALRRGYASVLSLPLKNKKTFGALAIYSAEPHAFDEEEIDLLIGLANDLAYGITALRSRDERRRAEEALRESEEKYRGLMDYASDAILLVDPSGKVTEANRRAEELLGYPQAELLGMDYVKIYPPEEADNVRKKFREIARKGAGQLIDFLAVRKDGRQVPVDVTGSLIKFANQKVTQEILRDVTERKKTEEILRDSEQKLRLLASQLLSVQEGERRRLARELHDELGQALTVLKIHLVAIEEKLRQDQQPLKVSCEELLQYIDGVIENVRRLSWDLSPSILEDLGLTSSLGYLIDEICRNHHIRELVTMDEIDHLFSPETQINIYRIFQESLTNIVKHAQASQVTVSIERQGRQVSFLIRDNGRGLEAGQAHSRHISQRSLGLTAMQERVLMANGKLRIASRKGKGTRVSFTIPIDHPGE